MKDEAYGTVSRGSIGSIRDFGRTRGLTPRVLTAAPQAVP